MTADNSLPPYCTTRADYYSASVIPKAAEFEFRRPNCPSPRMPSRLTRRRLTNRRLFRPTCPRNPMYCPMCRYFFWLYRFRLYLHRFLIHLFCCQKSLRSSFQPLPLRLFRRGASDCSKPEDCLYRSNTLLTDSLMSLSFPYMCNS